MRVIYKPNVAGSGLMWKLSGWSSAGYSKLTISLKGQNGGEQVRVHYGSFTNVVQDVTLTTSWQEITINADALSANILQLNSLNAAFIIELLDDKASTSTVFFDKVSLN